MMGCPKHPGSGGIPPDSSANLPQCAQTMSSSVVIIGALFLVGVVDHTWKCRAVGQLASFGGPAKQTLTHTNHFGCRAKAKIRHPAKLLQPLEFHFFSLL